MDMINWLSGNFRELHSDLGISVLIGNRYSAHSFKNALIENYKFLALSLFSLYVSDDFQFFVFDFFFVLESQILQQ